MNEKYRKELDEEIVRNIMNQFFLTMKVHKDIKKLSKICNIELDVTMSEFQKMRDSLYKLLDKMDVYYEG